MPSKWRVSPPHVFALGVMMGFVPSIVIFVFVLLVLL
jgi:hypothetical protein